MTLDNDIRSRKVGTQRTGDTGSLEATPDCLDAWVERALRDTDRILLHALGASAERVPPTLCEAMHYACQGGKRLRPLLVFASAQAAAAAAGFPDAQAVVRSAAVVELIHVHSLVFDDLPAMDDSDVRRNRQTVHRAFDEATAMLAATALLVRAFELLSDASIPGNLSARMLAETTRAIGAEGVIAGQLIDLQLNFHENHAAAERQVQHMHDLKTGQLIRLACRLGPLSMNAAPELMARLDLFGQHLGRAFQALDDVLDETGNAQQLGKPTHQDDRAGRSTLSAALGVEQAVQVVRHATDQALDTIAALDQRGDPLRRILRDFVTLRLPD